MASRGRGGGCARSQYEERTQLVDAARPFEGHNRDDVLPSVGGPTGFGDERDDLHCPYPRPAPFAVSVSGSEMIELAYRTHWVSPWLSPARRERLAERSSCPPDLVVISPVKEWTCTSCCAGTGDLLLMRDTARRACGAPGSITWSSWPRAMLGSPAGHTGRARCPRSWSGSAGPASGTSATACSLSPRRWSSPVVHPGRVSHARRGRSAVRPCRWTPPLNCDDALQSDQLTR